MNDCHDLKKNLKNRFEPSNHFILLFLLFGLSSLAFSQENNQLNIENIQNDVEVENQNKNQNDEKTDIETESIISKLRIQNSLEIFAYQNQAKINKESAINPNNQRIKLPKSQTVLDARLDWRAQLDHFDVLLQPRFVVEQNQIQIDYPENQNQNQKINKTNDEAILSQGFVRYKSGAHTFLIGREVFTWGPAQFRSPSNPFYFDAGRTNPLAALKGLNMARATFGLGSLLGGSWRATIAKTEDQHKGNNALLKIDHQGSEHLLSLIVNRQTHLNSNQVNNPDYNFLDSNIKAHHFMGGFAQFTLNDASILYGELGSKKRQLNADYLNNQNNINNINYLNKLDYLNKRQTSYLLGTSYTIENGSTFYVEYLRDSANLGFWNQTTNSLLKAKKINESKNMWIGWQSNPQNSDLILRTEWTRSLNDQSQQMMFYAEKNFNSKLSVLSSIIYASGSNNDEWNNLVKRRFLLGAKVWF